MRHGHDQTGAAERMNRWLVLKRQRARPAAARLARLKVAPGLVAYCNDLQLGGGRRPFWFSFYGLWASAEIFVEVTDGTGTVVRSFVSKHPDFPLHWRRDQIPLVDADEALALVRSVVRRWSIHFRTFRS